VTGRALAVGIAVHPGSSKATPCSQSKPDQVRYLGGRDIAHVAADVAKSVGCPFGTGRDRCQWHSCGTPGVEDAWLVRRGAIGSQIVGEGENRRSRQVGFELAPAPPHVQSSLVETPYDLRFWHTGRDRSARLGPAIPDAMRTQHGPARPHPYIGFEGSWRQPWLIRCLAEHPLQPPETVGPASFV
jgi:hypothetical protein